MRKCFECRKNYPQWMYFSDNNNYNVRYCEGRSVCCRFCNSKKVWDGIVLARNKTNKIILKRIKPNVFNYIKYFIGLHKQLTSPNK